MGSIMRPSGPFNVKRIAIIGAGPTGLAAAKFLIAEKAFDKIDIYEQQAEVGGIWHYTPTLAERVPVPQTSPRVPLEKPIWPKDATAPVFSNPMYERLNTNIPKPLMQFTDLDFPSESLIFPSRQDVQEYLIKYAQDIRYLISFSTQVEDIAFSSVDGNDLWTLIATSTVTGEKSHHEYDAIIVANGHYSVPWIPDVPGIKEFNAAYPSVISHSKIYRSPDPFGGKKVIVVGNAASGLDIGNQISAVCKTPLLNSVREPAELPLEGKTKEVPAIVEYLVDEKAVRFEDRQIEKDIDAIVYCTGYLYSYPFLKSLEPTVVTTGRRVVGVWQQIFCIAHPTLAFTALPQKINPFPLAQAQGAAIAKVWANQLSLLSTEEMYAWEKSRVKDLGDGTAFQVYGFPAEPNYVNYLHDWVKTADNGFSIEPPFWDEKMKWLRTIYVDARKKFHEDGRKAKTLEELGFCYEEHAEAS